MQQFKGKLKNVPTGAPQACSSTSPSLNREEILSERDKVWTLNNLDVDQHRHKGGQTVSAIAYVLSREGKPLMPCSPRKARILLKKKEAHVIKINPFFVIQLDKETSSHVQYCSLGIDSGSVNIGFSSINKEKELVCGTLEMDKRTSKRLTERKMYRRHRRNCLWYRQPRFNNRKNKTGWLPPSIQRKFDTHMSLINKLKKILPINKINIESGNFDIQKIENPDIKGIQYQQGSLYEYHNMRSFLMAREHGKCQLCGKEFNKNNGSHIHHIIPKSDGGTNREKNLALLHENCHKKLHKEQKYALLKKNKAYKDASFMNIIGGKFRSAFPDCHITYGNETFVKRNALRLEKTHYNDAFVIAGGTSQIKTDPIILKQKHRNNRSLQLNRKGFRPSIRRQRYSIQPYDSIVINNKKYEVKGSHNYGKMVLCANNGNSFNFNIKKIEKVFHTNSIYLALC